MIFFTGLLIRIAFEIAVNLYLIANNDIVVLTQKKGN